MTSTTVFWNGRSQAVRIPKEFRFSGERVLVEKVGERVILSPMEKEWSAEFWSCLGVLGSDVERPEQGGQDRETLF